MKEKIFLITGLFLASVCLLIIFNCNTKTLAISSSSNQVIAQVGNTNNSNVNSNNTNVVGTITLPQSKYSSLTGLLVAGINWLLGIGGAIAILAIIYSGLMYITAGTDPSKAETAKKNLTWAITGTVIAILSLVIVHWTVLLVTNGVSGSNTTNNNTVINTNNTTNNNTINRNTNNNQNRNGWTNI